MQKSLILLFAIFANIVAFAQVKVDHLLSSIPLRNLGPAAMSGRVTAIAIPRSTAAVDYKNTIYCGAASGGVWKSQNGGVSWKPIFDEMDVQSIGSIAIDPTNANIIYVGTGEGNPRNSHNSGKGIYKSLDAGKTWKCLGLEQTKTIHRIVINPQNPKQIFVASMGSIWGKNDDRGVFRSDDAGETWKKVLFVNSTTGCGELVMDENHPNKLFACMYDYERKPYTFRSGGEGSGIYVTNDWGASWEKLGHKNGLPKGNIGRSGMAISLSNPDKIYALIESDKNTLFRSSDGGKNWSKITQNANIGNRPFYYAEIYVDPSNENRIFSIWSQISKSEDGGKNWDILADWGHIHPDHHAFFVHPDDPNYIINGNDGGLNISLDGGNTWRFAENIPVGQFYHVNVDQDVPYHIYGGLQDNGSWVGPGFTFKHGGIPNHEWQELLFGDGFDVVPIENNSLEGYAMYQGGNVYHYNLKTQKTTYIKPVHPEIKNLRFNWNAAIAPIPGSPNSLYFGSQFLHVSHNKGISWNIISPDLTTNDTSKLHQERSGGITIDATGAENYCTIISIAPSLVSPTKKIYVGTDDGQIQLTEDGGKNWQNLTKNIAGLPKNAWISMIVLDTNAKIGKLKEMSEDVWVVANNYRQNDWKPYLFKSLDGGKTWQNMITNAIQGHCLSLVVDPRNQKLIFLGTDQGFYYSLNGGVTWDKWRKFPSCPVQDLKIQDLERDLVIGTFGRGVWVVDDIESFYPFVTIQNSKKNIQILSATHGYVVDYMQPAGMRFGADGVWNAPNKPYGCNLTLAVNSEQKNGDWVKQDFEGKVFDISGKQIRCHKFSFDSTGVYRIQWRMIEDGYYFPSHSTPKKDETLPPGRLVKPGKYKLIIGRKETKFDSVWVEVMYPKNDFDETHYNQQTLAIDKFQPLLKSSFDIFEGLKQMEKSVLKLSDESWENDSVSQFFSLNKAKMLDSIKQYKSLFMLAEDITYYEESTVRLNHLLEQAYSFIFQRNETGSNVESSIGLIDKELTRIKKRINQFIETDWFKFEAIMKKSKLKMMPNIKKYE